MKKVRLFLGLSFAFLSFFGLGLSTAFYVKDSTPTVQKMDKPGPPGGSTGGDVDTTSYNPSKSDM